MPETNKPTENGFYWVKVDESPHWTVAQVEISMWSTSINALGYGQLSQSLKVEWGSKIEVPYRRKRGTSECPA